MGLLLSDWALRVHRLPSVGLLLPGRALRIRRLPSVDLLLPDWDLRGHRLPSVGLIRLLRRWPAEAWRSRELSASSAELRADRKGLFRGTQVSSIRQSARIGTRSSLSSPGRRV